MRFAGKILHSRFKKIPEHDENIIKIRGRGNYTNKNTLNNLTGKEWVRESKSWYVIRPEGRKKTRITSSREISRKIS